MIRANKTHCGASSRLIVELIDARHDGQRFEPFCEHSTKQVRQWEWPHGKLIGSIIRSRQIEHVKSSMETFNTELLCDWTSCESESESESVCDNAKSSTSNFGNPSSESSDGLSVIMRTSNANVRSIHTTCLLRILCWSRWLQPTFWSIDFHLKWLFNQWSDCFDQLIDRLIRSFVCFLRVNASFQYVVSITMIKLLSYDNINKWYYNKNCLS